MMTKGFLPAAPLPGGERRERLIVVGNGMAAMRTIEALLERAPDRFDITVFGAEPGPAYNRILLSAVLAGERSVADIVTHSRRWFHERGIALIAGDPVTTIDRAGQTVRSAAGIRLGYDALLLATGSRPVALGLPGLSLHGVTAFRDLDDVDRMLAVARSHTRAVVIGGGLLGLEAAWGLKRRGMAVTVVHLMPILMERQLDAAAAGLLHNELTARGITILTGAQTEAILGGERVEGVRLDDGRELAADLVVMAVGARPNIDLARDAGLDLNRGIRVGDDMRTSDPAIYAVGECVEHNGRTFGLVAPLWEQARVCAARLAGDLDAVYLPQPVYTGLQITGIDVFSAGVIAPAVDDDEVIVRFDSAAGLYRKLVLRGDRLVGCVLYGDAGDGLWYVELMSRRCDVAPWRDALILGREAAEAAGIAVIPPTAAAA
jgi:nitrite reductase [NAD(P)H] large subunit